jgi:exonuclease III
MKKEDNTIFYNGRKDERHENGVRFIVNDDTLPQVKGFTAVNDRLCYIRIAGPIFDVIIINAYVPTEEKEEYLKNEFYDDLEKIIDTTTNSCIKILIGDFNAKIWKEDMYRPTIGLNDLHDVSNDNGTRLINLCLAKGFNLSSTYFTRKDIHKQTWIAPSAASLKLWVATP